MAPTQKAIAAGAVEAKAAAEPTADTTPGSAAVATADAERRYDPRKMLYVFDTETGAKLVNPVPETWLDGRFPQLSETPSKKAGK